MLLSLLLEPNNLKESSKESVKKIFDVYVEDAKGDDETLHYIIKSRYVSGAINNSNKDIEAMWDLYKDYTKK